MDNTTMLSLNEFTEKYPVGSFTTWAKVLVRFREDGKLVQGQHWWYDSQWEGSGPPPRIYSERKVLRLCRAMTKERHCPPFYHRLFQECRATILSAFEPTPSELSSIAKV